MDQPKYQEQIKNLIERGNERGYLLFRELDGLLPFELDSEKFQQVIEMFREMGISVHEEAPDGDSLLMAEPDLEAIVADTDEEVEAAAAVLAMIDGEYGRTTDPVRMYMREMGAVELLTRQGEIEIAKRIEKGLGKVLATIASYPQVLGTLITAYQKIVAGEGK
jgi:RNA polymerase primary sigma factor